MIKAIYYLIIIVSGLTIFYACFDIYRLLKKRKKLFCSITTHEELNQAQEEDMKKISYAINSKADILKYAAVLLCSVWLYKGLINTLIPYLVFIIFSRY